MPSVATRARRKAQYNAARAERITRLDRKFRPRAEARLQRRNSQAPWLLAAKTDAEGNVTRQFERAVHALQRRASGGYTFVFDHSETLPGSAPVKTVTLMGYAQRIARRIAEAQARIETGTGTMRVALRDARLGEGAPTIISGPQPGTRAVVDQLKHLSDRQLLAREGFQATVDQVEIQKMQDGTTRLVSFPYLSDQPREYFVRGLSPHALAQCTAESLAHLLLVTDPADVAAVKEGQITYGPQAENLPIDAVHPMHQEPNTLVEFSARLAGKGTLVMLPGFKEAYKGPACELVDSPGAVFLKPGEGASYLGMVPARPKTRHAACWHFNNSPYGGAIWGVDINVKPRALKP